MEKNPGEPHLPDTLRDPKLPTIHAAFAPNLTEQRLLGGAVPPSVDEQEAESRRLEQL